MMKPIKTTSAFDFSETDSQTFDSQFSPSSVYGEDFKGQDVDELLFLQNTLPFDDTVRVEDTFETQVVNLGGETQVLDGPDCVENMDTQLLLEHNNEVIVDSDGEGTDRTEVLGDTDELSDDDSVKRVGNHPVDLANMLHASLCKQGDQGFKAESNALSNEQCSSGEKFKGEDVYDDVYELQFLQSAVPFDDTVPLEDAFETQMMNLGGETQALDDPPCVENMGTQLLVECDNEAVDDSDGEATIRTEVLGNQELSGNDSVERVCNDPVDQDNMLYTTLCKQNNRGFKAESDAYNEQHSSELNVPTATPLDKDTAEPKAGSVRKGFTSVRAASLRASGLAARRKSFEGTNNGSCSVRSEFQSVKEHITDDDGVAFVRESSQFGEQVNQEHVMGDYNEQEKGFRNENKCRLGSSTVRKLFTEDTPAEVKRPNDHIDNATGGADLPQLLACDKELAGLSYVDSQEPGESSQANALDFVDRFLKFSVTEFDQEADLGKSTGDKSKHVSSAKGIQCLAKRVNYKSTVSGIFDWDDNREDERGGDFFSKMKESFFDNGGQSRRSFTKTQKLRRPDSKGSGAVNESRDKEERLSTHEKVVGVVHSDSRLEFHNKKGNDTTAKLTGTKFRKNLIKEADEQLNIGSSDAMEAAVTEKDMPDMLNVGFDTQMAAEAMEALCYGVDSSDLDRSDANEGAKSVSNNSLKGGKKNRAHCKHNFFQKKESSSNCIVVARQPKQTKRIDTKQSKESSVSSRKRSKNVKKQSDIELVNTKLKKAKCNTEDHLATNECWDNSPEVVKKGKEEKSLKINDIDESGKCHVTASSSGPKSVKKGLQEQLGTLTPIACRTRQRKKATTQAGNASTDVREGINDLTEVAVLKGKRKRSGKDVDSFEVLNATEKFSRVGSNLSGELENAKLSEHKQPGPKFTGKSTALKIDELSYPKGRRTHRKLSGQLNRTGNQHGPSKQHVGREANAQSIARLKRSKTDAISTCMDLSIKRQTRSSTCAGSVLSSLDLQSEQRLLQQKLVRGGSGDAALNHNSVDINGNTILKDKDGVQASQHIDRKSDADKTSSGENVGVNARLDTSPRERCKPSGSDCTTPVNCRTPINEASPICMGDEYLKQSCRKNLARSSLMKEIDSLIGDGLVRTSAFKDSRKRRDMANVRALFSHHLDDDIIKQQKKILARLGASIASSVSDATHFITDKFVRTRNMLEAIAFGKPVVTHLWLESCGQASCLIDEKNYILRDAKKEKEFGFSLPVSLARACQSSLLQGQKVLITPNTKPGKEVLVSLVKAVHGLAAERIGRSALKDDRIPDDLLILSCEEDYAVCVPFLEKGAAVYSSELLLNGIVTQKLEYERHRLFVDHVKRTRSTIWLKKDSNQYIPVTKHK